MKLVLANGTEGYTSICTGIGWFFDGAYRFYVDPINEKAEEAYIEIWKGGWMLYREYQKPLFPGDEPFCYDFSCPIINSDETKAIIYYCGWLEEEDDEWEEYVKFVEIEWAEED